MEVAAITGAAIVIAAVITGLGAYLGRKFDTLERRIDQIDLKFTASDQRIEARLESFEQTVDRRFQAMEQKSDGRFEPVERHFEVVEGELRGLRSDFQRGFETTHGLIIDTNRRIDALARPA